MRKNREETPAYLHGPWEYVGREPRFFRSPVFEIALFLYPVFAIITGVLKHLFTEPPSISYKDPKWDMGKRIKKTAPHAIRVRAPRATYNIIHVNPGGRTRSFFYVRAWPLQYATAMLCNLYTYGTAVVVSKHLLHRPGLKPKVSFSSYAASQSRLLLSKPARPKNQPLPLDH
jgi:hypothetical protein